MRGFVDWDNSKLGAQRYKGKNQKLGIKLTKCFGKNCTISFYNDKYISKYKVI